MNISVKQSTTLRYFNHSKIRRLIPVLSAVRQHARFIQMWESSLKVLVFIKLIPRQNPKQRVRQNPNLKRRVKRPLSLRTSRDAEAYRP